MIGPTSSRSGKNTSMRSMFFSWAIEMTRGVSSSLASRITSPVEGSTMSPAAKAPSRASSATSMASTPALRRAAIAEAEIFFPSPIVNSAPGTLISFFARSPIRLSPTDQ
jgi:hypothetical protein